MNYVTIYEEYKHKFFQLPKVLYTNEKYLGLSNNARVVWAILRERASLSRKNNWFEKETGRIYFIYTNTELCEVTKIKSPTTITNIKQELENVGLIEQKRRPNRPSILYLLYPEVDENDIYAIDEIETAAHPDEVPQSQSGQGTTKNGFPKNEVPDIQKLVTSNTDSSNTDFKELDTKDTKDTKTPVQNKNVDNFTDSEKQRLRNEYITRANLNNEDKIPKELAEVLNIFSNTTEQAEEYYKIIMIAIDKFSKDYDELIILEEKPMLLRKICDAFIRSVRKKEQQGNLKNANGYIYNTIYSTVKTEYQNKGLQNLSKNMKNSNKTYIEDFRKLLNGEEL